MSSMDEDVAEAPSSTALKPQELLERALKAKAQVKQRLGDLSREHREIETTMRSAPRDRHDGTSKRSRDDYRGRDDGPPPEQASKRRTVDAEGAEAGAVATEEGAGEATNVGDGKGAERRAARARERGSDSPGSRATPRDPRTKEDAETRQRNRKMFGGLMGHLRASKKDHEVASSGAGHAAVQQKALAKVELKLKESSQRLLAFERDFVHSKKDHDRRRRDQIRGQRSQLDGRLLEVTWDAHAARLTNFILTEVQPAIFYLPARHNEATAAKLEAQAERQMAKLASSVLHKADPLDGLDLTNEPPPSAAVAEDGGKEGGEKAEGGAADAEMEADAEAPEAQAEGKADEKEEPQPVEDEVEEPMMAGTELGAMLED